MGAHQQEDPDGTPASKRIFTRGEVYAALRGRFGLREFRPGQAEILRALLQGRHALAVLPTGAGKSLCYQLPAVLLPGTTLVLSPLIALMEDQVQALRSRGIAAGCLHGKQETGERLRTLRDLAAGRLDLLYAAPERLALDGFRAALARTEVPFVAVDEAHCVYQWGHDFRPAYLEIRGFLEELRPGRVAAFTATATPEVREQVARALGLEDPAVVVRGFHRTNLALETRRVRNEEERRERLLEAARDSAGGGVVLAYARTRRQAEETAAFLRESGLRALHYHGGAGAGERGEAQEAFLGDGLDVLVATNAFGMGIDKADLRLVVHLALPMSFEDWYQELGRAGRDGEPARNLVLWSGQDWRTADFLLRRSAEDDGGADPARVQAFREAALRRLNRVQEAFRGGVCLWRRILDYFGDPEAADLAEGCGHCTPCREPGRAPQAVGGREGAFLRRVLTGCARVGPRFGRRRLAALLAGSTAGQVPQEHPAHGFLRGETAARIQGAVDALLEAGYLRLRGDEYPVVALARKGREALGEEGDLVLRWDGGQAARAERSPARAARRKHLEAEERADARDADSALLGRLKAWRRKRAREMGVPPYVILIDRSLLALAARRPATEEELLAIPGIGPTKAARHGAELLALVSGQEAEGGEEGG